MRNQNKIILPDNFLNLNNKPPKLKYMIARRLLPMAVLLTVSFTIIKAQNIKPVNYESRTNVQKYSLEDFSFNLNSSLSPSNHLWVMSGWCTVAPVSNTVMGVGDCIGPPLAGMDFKMMVTIEANGHIVKDIGSTGKGDVGLLYSGGKWRPDRIIRYGTYHFIVSDEIISFSVQSELVPLYTKTGFLLKIILKNRTDKTLRIKFYPEIDPGKPAFNPLNNWTYGKPPRGNDAKPEGMNHWSNETVAIDLIHESQSLEIPAKSGNISYLAVVFTGVDQKVPSVQNLKEWEVETERAWNLRLQRVLKNLPVLKSDIPGMDDYYKRSLVSGLVCIWENPAFILNPFLSSLGIDGGGMCSYIWDTGGYIPQITTLMLENKMIDYAKAMTSVDLGKYYAFTIDGSGVGVSYSYNIWSFVNLVWTLWKQVGIQEELYNEAKRLVIENEKLQSEKNGLINYGVQENLLEMRSAGWEHFVASPNAERAWCLERLADMGEYAGFDSSQVIQWRSMAFSIKDNIQKTLWNQQKKWFDCLYPDGHKETVFSIQAYDALRAGVCTKEMEDNLVSYLRESTFLFPYGISSISAEDEVHFEVNDPDWSGGGAYIGDGPELALIMYELGRPALAMDILKRFFWMGKHLPYYPQEQYADRPAVPAHKRANEISALSGAQVILYGMAGFDHRIDGSLWINPQFPENARTEIMGYRWKQNTVDILYKKNVIAILLNDKKIYEGEPKKIRIL